LVPGDVVRVIQPRISDGASEPVVDAPANMNLTQASQ
jgi:hypothetical protein